MKLTSDLGYNSQENSDLQKASEISETETGCFDRVLAIDLPLVRRADFRGAGVARHGR
jgi:hypothetical protein